jgi:DNA-binding transcriptional regulator YhcF (GntR family)
MTADEVFNILKEYYKRYKKFPTVEEFANYSEYSIETIIKLYKRWITQGKIVKKGDSLDFYREDPNKLFAEDKKQEPDNLVIHKPKKEQSEKKDYKDITLRCIVGFIGVLLVFNSVHFTFEFNHLSMKLFWAFTLSVSIVTFMSIAFTLAHYTNEKYMKVFILLLWLLGFSYSVFTAVSGQYNDFRKYLSTDKSEIIDNQKTILNNQLDIQIKKQKELVHWREQETEYNMNPDLKTENPGTWKKIQEGLVKLEECENKIEELQNQIMDIVEVDIVSEETVYSWLCKILGISSNKLHFIIVLFPAIFIDLCSGVCLMFALKKKEN